MEVLPGKKKRFWALIVAMLFIIGYCMFDLFQNASESYLHSGGKIIGLGSVVLLYFILKPASEPESEEDYYRQNWFKIKFLTPAAFLLVLLNTHVGFLRHSLLQAHSNQTTCIVTETCFIPRNRGPFRRAAIDGVRYVLTVGDKHYSMHQFEKVLWIWSEEGSADTIFSEVLKGDPVEVRYLPEIPCIAEIVRTKRH